MFRWPRRGDNERVSAPSQSGDKTKKKEGDTPYKCEKNKGLRMDNNAVGANFARRDGQAKKRKELKLKESGGRGMNKKKKKKKEDEGRVGCCSGRNIGRTKKER